jgi:acetyl-CoA C-acetyltransferase
MRRSAPVSLGQSEFQICHYYHLKNTGCTAFFDYAILCTHCNEISIEQRRIRALSNRGSANITDRTPVLVGAGQYTERIDPQQEPPLNPPVELAARASQRALDSTGGQLSAEDIDAIAMIRLFSDSVPAWACPFGRSDNPPESVARRIGACPTNRIYSNVSGTQPLQLLAELSAAIQAGDIDCALLTGAEAIASQRYALRNGLEPDWNEACDAPMDSREYTQRFADKKELTSGMYLPVHYYALIENLRAHQQGNNHREHLEQMAQLLAPMSEVARDNPHAYFPKSYSAEELQSTANGNYPISLPYSKFLVAQDAVNQAASLILTSAGKARELGIPEKNWILQLGYAEGDDQYLFQRQDPGTSLAMRTVLDGTLKRANCGVDELDLIDIYSCFPCAVEAVAESLCITADDPRGLTVTGGLPFFGGPGNNYSTHALAEMVIRLRGEAKLGLVTANGGQLTKHAAVVLASACDNDGKQAHDFGDQPKLIGMDDIAPVPACEEPGTGRVISYTVIFERKNDDKAVVLAESSSGERFLARSADTTTVAEITDQCPIGRDITVQQIDGKNFFAFRSN